MGGMKGFSGSDGCVAQVQEPLFQPLLEAPLGCVASERCCPRKENKAPAGAALGREAKAWLNVLHLFVSLEAAKPGGSAWECFVETGPGRSSIV